MQEKRRHPRIAIRIPISCEIAGQEPASATTADVSIGGMLIEADFKPPFGTELTIIGDFPRAPGLRLPGIVRWASPGGFGVQFGLLGARETHAVIALVQTGRA